MVRSNFTVSRFIDVWPFLYYSGQTRDSQGRALFRTENRCLLSASTLSQYTEEFARM